MSAEDEFTRPPPHDIQAERFTLAAIMGTSVAASNAALDDVLEILEPGDFYRPAHQVIFHAMVMLRVDGAPITPVTLREELSKSGEMRALGGAADGPLYLADLFGMPVMAQTAAHHAQIVFDRSVRRRAVERATRVIQAAYELGQDAAEVAAMAAEQFAAIPGRAQVDPAGQLMTGAQFAALSTVRTEPVVNGLLHREDRVIVVAEEGHGKSMLAAQVGWCAAAGLNPFLRDITFPGRRVLLVDFENPRSELQDRVRMFEDLAGRSAAYDRANFMVWSWPQGIDLGRSSDAHMLAEQIRRACPDLVVAGPVGKMIVDTGQHSEQVHSKVTRFWDVMRGRYGFALWLEHHAPLQQGRAPRLMRPKGSGVYSTWPEFGLALIPNGTKGVLKVDRFRGDRIRGRFWPDELGRHEFYGREWPWQAHKWDPAVLNAGLAFDS